VEVVVKIQVTEEDIKNGTPCQDWCCPIALALRRAGFLAAKVGRSRCFVQSAGDDETCTWRQPALPADAREFVRDFDEGYPVDPFEFDLEGA
jgi:hypothetical protein